MEFIFAEDMYKPKTRSIIHHFDSLDDFVRWTNTSVCPRFVLIPPQGKNTWSGETNPTDYWVIRTYPDYD